MKKLLLLAIASYSSLYAASGKETSLHLAFQELRSQIEQQQYLVNSQRVDIDLLQEKLHELDASLHSLKNQLGDQSKIERELTKDRIASIEKRLTSLEKTNDTIISDLQQLKNHCNDSSSSLAQFKTKISDLEKQCATDIKNLKKATESLMTLLQRPKEPSLASVNKTYRVKPGDSLSKIAQDLNVELKALRELNHIDNDKIIVGQTLQLP